MTRPSPLDQATAPAAGGDLAQVRAALGYTPERLARSLHITVAELAAAEAGHPVEPWHLEHIQGGLVAIGLLRYWRPHRQGYERADGVRVASTGMGVYLRWPREAPGPSVPDPRPDATGPILRRDVVQLMLAAQRERPCLVPVSELAPRCPGCGCLGDDGRVWCRRCHGNGCDRCGSGMVACEACCGPRATFVRAVSA